MRRNQRGAQIFERAQDFISSSRDLARDGAERANSFIHESPVVSTMVGVGAGLLLGFLMRRRD